MKLANAAIALLILCSGSQALAQNAPVGARSLNDQLIQDAKDGSVAGVQQDLGNGADVNAKHKNGRTALMLTAEWGSQGEVAGVLLAHGADLSAKDKDGRTALMWAVQFNTGMVRLLVAHGADVNAKANDGATALSIAESGDVFGSVDEDIVGLLHAHGAQ